MPLFKAVGLRGRLTEIASLDLRSLAVYRMAIALLLLLDQWMTATSLRAFYSNDGVLPLKVFLENRTSSAGQWSLYFGSDSLLFTAVLLAFSALAAVALLVGYRTRLATVVCWVMVCSLQARNPMILQGSDGVIRLLLFWSMFLPLGGCWSVDAGREIIASNPLARGSSTSEGRLRSE